MTKIKKIFLILFLIVVFVAGIFVWQEFFARREAAPFMSPSDTSETEEMTPVSLAAKDLNTPWSLEFLPNGGLIFTERAGRVNLIEKTGFSPQLIISISDVVQKGEGGLLGIAKHPEFEKNGYMYLYYTYQLDNERLANKVVRYRMQGASFIEPKIVIDGIPGAGNHNGGRIKFGPDKLLYIATGDAEDADLAQDKNSFAGKILRLTSEGGVPQDNPFKNAVYSYGHRNPQGMTWDDDGMLWATEHGASATDELNLIEPGKNYGWPVIRGDEKRQGMITPIIQSGEETWAPSGAAYYKGSIFFAGLRSQTLFEYKMETKELLSHFEGKFGRLRDVVLDSDGNLYIGTSNRDGRGIPRNYDDRIIKINLEKI